MSTRILSSMLAVASIALASPVFAYDPSGPPADDPAGASWRSLGSKDDTVHVFAFERTTPPADDPSPVAIRSTARGEVRAAKLDCSCAAHHKGQSPRT